MRQMMILLATLFWSWAAVASDGVIELNQSCALHTGCLPGDAPGFPITLSSGSYVVTSDLRTSSVAEFGIDVKGAITLDFNGFALRSFPIGGSVGGSGIIGSSVVASGSTIKNGTVDFFRTHGIWLYQAKGVTIENMVVTSNLNGGIDVGLHARLIGNSVYSNTDFGIRVHRGTLMRENVVFETTDGPDVTYLTGAIDDGGNVCEDATCRRRSYRRYYLTNSFYPANAVQTACVEGFHLASVYELAPGHSFQYDPNLGVDVQGNGDTGPPAPWNNYLGYHASGTSTADQTCNRWQSISSTQTGRAGGYEIDPATGVAVWHSVNWPCSDPASVWCVED